MTVVTKPDVKADSDRAADMKFFDKIFLSMTLFIVGGVIMMLELVGTRILAPFFGNTIYTWSSLITVTLVALAIGYFVGGVTADKKPDLKILYLIIYLVCIWMVFIPHLRYRVLLASSSYDIRLGTLLSASVLFALPLTLLGTAVPFAIKMKTERLKTVGTTAGFLFAISTVGSFIGTILTGFYLIPNMGVGRIMFLGALLLLAISSIWFLSRKDWKFFLTLFVVFLFSSSLAPSIAASPGLREGVDIVYKEQGLYGEIKVIDMGWQRYLLVGGSLQMGIDKVTGESLSPYLQYLEMAIIFVPEPRDVLAVGLGGGWIQRKFGEYGLRVDTVEIDPMMVDVATEYFDFKEGNVYIGDGRYFIQRTEKKYDIVILDAFSGATIPFHLLSVEMFHVISDRLNEDGVLVINTIGRRDSKLQGSIEMTLMQVYPEVYAFTDGYSQESIVFFAFKKSLKEKGDLSSYGLENLRIICEERCDQYPYSLFPYILEHQRVGIDVDKAMLLSDDHNPSELLWTAGYADESLKSHIRFFGEAVMLR